MKEETMGKTKKETREWKRNKSMTKQINKRNNQGSTHTYPRWVYL
jgi:hypothetical protein